MATEKRRLYELDLLRFLAAMFVLLFHLGFRGHAADNLTILSYPLLEPIAKYMFFGSRQFLLISGFVVMMSAKNKTATNFIASRALRLYPTFWICCTLTFITIVFMGDHTNVNYQVTIPQYILNLTLFGDVFGVEAIDGDYWTIYVLLKFYILVSILLFFKQFHRIKAYLVGWLILTIICTIHPIKYEGLVILPEFSSFIIAGATCYLIWSEGWSKLSVFLLSASLIVAEIRILMFLPSHNHDHNVVLNPYIVVGIVASFFVIMVLVATGKTNFINKKGFAILGTVTYPLYLLHQYIGYLLFNAGYHHINIHILFWGVIAGLIVLSYYVNMIGDKIITDKFIRPSKLYSSLVKGPGLSQ